MSSPKTMQATRNISPIRVAFVQDDVNFQWAIATALEVRPTRCFGVGCECPSSRAGGALGAPEDMLLADLGLSGGNADMNNFRNKNLHEIFIY
jgi:hypothetical protein